MEIFRKTAAEIYPVTIDFTNRLPTGTTVASGSGSARNMRTDASASSVFVSTNLTVTDTTAKGVVTGGSVGDDYEMTFTATLSDGSVLVEQLLMRVI